mmetsp:Transcript_13242/g.37622  ORF Transcript_13242/g.37622 Transcript_13242/m.37622 type:complete len:236 (+) Transcript_13242:611-1318(+)
MSRAIRKRSISVISSYLGDPFSRCRNVYRSPFPTNSHTIDGGYIEKPDSTQRHGWFRFAIIKTSLRNSEKASKAVGPPGPPAISGSSVSSPNFSFLIATVSPRYSPRKTSANPPSPILFSTMRSEYRSFFPATLTMRISGTSTSIGMVTPDRVQVTSALPFITIRSQSTSGKSCPISPFSIQALQKMQTSGSTLYQPSVSDSRTSRMSRYARWDPSPRTMTFRMVCFRRAVGASR